MKNFTRLVTAAAVACAIVQFTGCATQANSQAMVAAKPAQLVKQYPFSVSVATSGGTDTSAAGRSEISDAELKAAIEKSIVESKLFKDVVQTPNPSQYHLAVAVVQMDKPMFGTSFTITLETNWTLTRSSDKQIVWRQSVKGTHTATMSDAFVGATRLRLALEGAARANIANGIDGISIAAIDAPRTAAATPAR